MAGIQAAIRRTVRHTQDAQIRFARGGTQWGPDNTVTPTWFNATAISQSEWLEVRDSNYLLVQVNVIGGTFTAAIQGSIDNGKTFYSMRPIDVSTGAVTAAVTFSAAGLYLYNAPIQYAKVDVSAFATGPIEFWFSVLRV